MALPMLVEMDGAALLRLLVDEGLVVGLSLQDPLLYSTGRQSAPVVLPTHVLFGKRQVHILHLVFNFVQKGVVPSPRSFIIIIVRYLLSD